ncbi:MAG: lysine--tRNA ligase, partial [Planctomycetes bacterium]|nr:lysine--tRNA ligase [Planctomycetota bacterium]
YRDNMQFIQRMIQQALQELLGTQQVTHGEHVIDFSGDWPEKSFAQLLKEDACIDIAQYETRDALVQAIRERGISLEFDRYPSRAGLIDGLYKTVSRPKLIQPVFLTEHPTELTPLARRNDENPGIVDRFQLVVNTWEVVNAYSELVDPIDQLERLREQQAMKAAGDDETMMLEKDYIECMEHGMPPISGLGLGIDRFMALLCNQDNLRDVVLFPMMRPQVEGSSQDAAPVESES